MSTSTLGTWSTGEQTLVPHLLPDLEPDMLVLLDRGFYSYKLFQAITGTGAQVVFRVTSKLILPMILRLLVSEGWGRGGCR